MNMIETAAAIAAAQAEVDRLREAIAVQTAGRSDIEAAINDAESAYADAQAAHGEALARRALDEATDDEVNSTKSTLKAAATDLERSRKGLAKAADHALAVQCLQSRLEAAQAEHGRAIAADKTARGDASVQHARDKVAEYERCALQAAAALACAKGALDHCAFEHGRPLSLINGIAEANFPGVAGSSEPIPDFPAMVLLARQEAVQKFGISKPDPANFVQPVGRFAGIAVGRPA
jgi:chromosome segregation ATPase